MCGARLGLGYPKAIVVSDIWSVRAGDSESVADQELVHEAVADVHISEKPAVAISFGRIGVKADRLSFHERAIAFGCFLRVALGGGARMGGLRSVDPDVAHDAAIGELDRVAIEDARDFSLFSVPSRLGGG